MRLLQTISLAFCMPYLQNRFMTSVYSRFPYHVLREVYKKLGEICFLETFLSLLLASCQCLFWQSLMRQTLLS